MKPQIEGTAETITVTEGSNVTLSCNAFGSPQPVLKWKPDVTAMDHTRVKVEGPDLLITNVRVKDGGVYTCSAVNVLGGASKVISLNILSTIYRATCLRYLFLIL